MFQDTKVAESFAMKMRWVCVIRSSGVAPPQSSQPLRDDLACHQCLQRNGSMRKEIEIAQLLDFKYSWARQEATWNFGH
jgi:hypothetical protein